MAMIMKQNVLASKMATRKSVVAKADRGVWLPNLVPPKHLDGSMIGDVGFDPLGLGQDAGRVKWYQEAEKTNGRWAMMAVAGILGQEALGVTPKWFMAGAAEYDLPISAQLPVLFATLGFLETKRLQGYKETGTSGFLNSFPFDPAGLNSPTNALKEIKNGRVAMVAFVGFAVQALVTRQGPIEGLTTHLGDSSKNILYYVTHLPETLSA
eukprot:gene23352-30604_t